MLAQASLVPLILGVLTGLTLADDLVEVQTSFDFIYHEDHNLLLTIHNGTCYYSTIPDKEKWRFDDQHIKVVEGQVANLIITKNDTLMTPTTLDEMRKQYQDLLANFHCQHEDVISLTLFPPDEVTCNFDTETRPTCNFVQDLTDDFDWTRQSGATPTPNTGPMGDHTSGSGHYMFIETSEPQSANDTARLISEVYKNSEGNPGCLRFAYHMFGFGMGTLNVLVSYDQSGTPVQTPVWSQTGDQGNQWLEAEIDLNAPGDFKLIFEGIRGKSYFGDLAIDDVTVSRDSCNPPINCDFESVAEPTCGFQQSSTDDFDWTMGQGETPTAHTGPSVDSTLGTSAGHYMFIESSEPRMPGEGARIEKQIGASGTGSARCLRFSYHMYGSNEGTLNVYATDDNSTQAQPLWSFSGNHDDQWQQAEVDIPFDTEFKLTFEGIIGAGYRATGDTAIDDIIIFDGACLNNSLSATLAAIVTTTVPTSPTTIPITTASTILTTTTSQPTTSTTPTTTTTTPSTTSTPPSTTTPPTTTTTTASSTETITTTRITTAANHGQRTSPCDKPTSAIFRCCFGNSEGQYGFCGMHYSYSENFHWSRYHGERTTQNTGPQFDHSFGNSYGHYAYIDASSHRPHDKAHLVTKTFNNFGHKDHCLKFYYHMHGSDIGALNVYYQYVYDQSVNHKVFSRQGEQGTSWHQAQVTIPMHQAFDIIFEGVVGNGNHGDVAIDDIFLYEGACNSNTATGNNQTTQPHTTTPTPTQHSATNNRIRLVDGAGPTSGRVEINSNGQWGTILTENLQAAKVACHMLGITHGTPYVMAHPSVPRASAGTPILMHEVYCNGGEHSIWNCHHRGGSGGFAHDSDLGIGCGHTCKDGAYNWHDGETIPTGTTQHCVCRDGTKHCSYQGARPIG